MDATEDATVAAATTATPGNDSGGGAPRFALLPVDRSADALEREVLAAWESEQLFTRVQEARAGGEPWIFFEGPPTANGRPGIHHVWARLYKDIYPRFHTMRG